MKQMKTRLYIFPNLYVLVVFVMIFPNRIFILTQAMKSIVWLMLQHDHALNRTRSHGLYVAQHVHVKTFI